MASRRIHVRRFISFHSRPRAIFFWLTTAPAQCSEHTSTKAAARLAAFQSHEGRSLHVLDSDGAIETGDWLFHQSLMADRFQISAPLSERCDQLSQSGPA